MRKNTGSQIIGAQMVNATTGAAFTGSVTIYVTGDGATQAVGSVGSGACTHEGNGFHTYVPAQAETNYDHIGFTFTGTGAVPSTVQVYTSFPQTGDSFARIGAPAGASISADIATVDTVVDGIQTDLSNGTDGLGAIKADTAAILVDTAVIGAAGAGLTAIPWNASWDVEVESEVTDALNAYDPPTKAELDSAVAPLATAANLATVAGYLDTEIAAILEDTGTTLPAAIAALNDLDAGEVATAVWNAATATYGSAGSYGLLVETNLDAPVSVVDTVVDSIKLDTAAILVDTADMQPKLGTPAGASISADIAAIEAQTDDIGAAGAGLTAVPWNPSWDAEVQSEVADALVAFWTTPGTLVDLIWDEAIAGHAGAGSTGEALAGATAPTAAAVADAVWDEALAGHLSAGSTGEALNAAGAAGDPWTTTLPGAYTGSQAGKMLSDIITDTAEIGAAGAGLTAVPWNASWDAQVESEVTDALNAYDPPTKAELDSAVAPLATAANLATVAGYLDTEIAAILADTNELQTDWTNGGRLDLLIDAIKVVTDALPNSGALTDLATAAALATVAGYIDTEVAAIKAKTDNLPAAPAAVGDIPTALQNADALLDRDMAAVVETNPRSPLNALRFLRNKYSISGATLTVTKENDTTPAWTSVLTSDPAGVPITGSDPT